jgi:hypothetical protein
MPDVHQIIGTIFLALVIYFFWSINSRTRKAIDLWAEENGFNIVTKRYIPWHCTWIAGGIHPANFKVVVTNLKGEFEGYSIRVSGFFWLDHKLKIKRTKVKKHNNAT